MPAYTLADFSIAAFIIIPLLLAVALVGGVVSAWRSTGARERSVRAGVLSAVGAAAWMTVTWQAASTGVLQRWGQTPPPFALLVLAIIVIAVSIAFSGAGRRLAIGVPLWALVGVQGFRFPLEMAMHGLVARGIMPEQMSYSGRNFDILTGIGALVVAALLVTGIAGRRAVMVWNVAGSLLLLNVVTIAILSTPRLQYFGPDRLSAFVTYTPFVWLPAVMVLAALLGHLLVYRALRLRSVTLTPPVERV